MAEQRHRVPGRRSSGTLRSGWKHPGLPEDLPAGCCRASGDPALRLFQPAECPALLHNHFLRTAAQSGLDPGH